MSGEKHGEFIEVFWDYADGCLPVRGHVDKAEFNEAIGTHGHGPLLPTDTIRHTYWRVVPDKSGKWGGRYVFDCKPSPGAFAVTVLDL